MAPPAAPRPGLLDGSPGSRRFLFLCFAAGGGLLVLVAKALGVWLAVFVSFALILGYGLLLWNWSEKRATFPYAGDNLYYVGFLYTLISLAHSLYRFTAASASTSTGDAAGAGDVNNLVAGFGLALASTLFGLVGRVLLNEPEGDEPAVVEERSRLELVAAHRRLRAEMDTALADYVRFREDLLAVDESIEASRAAAAEKRKELAAETASLEDVHGIGSRLEQAATDALQRMAEIQQRTIEETAERHDQAASRLEEAAGSMAGAVVSQRQAFDAEADSLREAVGQSLERFRMVDFEREVDERVVGPASTHLARLLGGLGPLVEGLSRTQADQRRAAEANREILEQLGQVFSRNQELASGFERSAESLERSSKSLGALSGQVERQSERTAESVRQATAIVELLEALSLSLDKIAGRLESRRRNGFFARLFGRRVW